MTSISSSSAQLTCLCGAISASGTLLSSSEIPINAAICHCNPCRYTSGSLGIAFPLLKEPPPQETLSKLTGYNSSQKLTRYFCPTCGCHCFHINHHSQKWYCQGGNVEPSPAFESSNSHTDILWPKDTVKISHHDFVLDTVDGGLTPLLLNLNGRTVPTWSAASPPQPPSPQQEGHDSFDLPHETVLSLPRKSLGTLSSPKEDSYLPAKCHCGGVSLLIKRAIFDHEGPARYIPSDPTKYLTYLCACRSCRLSTGVSLTAWTLVPSENVFNANAPATASNDNESNLTPVVFGKPASSADANPGLSLTYHWSSPDVCRSFCGNCGATVFYWCGQRPDELDLATGILRAEEGSMARRWLEWVWGRCSFTEESVDQEMCEAWLGSAEEGKKSR
ncbi:uncharacterized protein Z518_03236 [Rhinocladiella mackenziei CBS 650.93]|uniref:CENP-V/GFA domain-containing protein n=1 Tax=Rhinocladiella mackenziei CBS 650.93 TaxID=1442369 RepID=A0A0D2JGX2_9EURO|nr:uncharacterized protein Z518_03236 [Rhinocladiella mackenziei CBS 650.93]KIX08580.1 hypothetical protein Z518_03236 [Rhinocladiella mackenziei CBS 650.93]